MADALSSQKNVLGHYTSREGKLLVLLPNFNFYLVAKMVLTKLALLRSYQNVVTKSPLPRIRLTVSLHVL